MTLKTRHVLRTFGSSRIDCQSIQDMYSNFLDVVKAQVAICILSKDVATGPKDPVFDTSSVAIAIAL
jgi:hypothetical protein